MKWIFENFNVELNKLHPKVKEKAVEIACGLMEKGYTQEKAINEGIKKAEEWFLNEQG